MANPLVETPTTRYMKRRLPGLRGLLELLELNSLDVLRFHEHFARGVANAAVDTATIVGSPFTTYTDNSGTAIFAAAVANGVCTLSTIGAVANNYIGLYIPNTPCSADRNAVLAVRLAPVSSIASAKYEVGFNDAPASNAGIVNVLSTPTFHSTNGVTWVYDTNDAGNSTAWQGAGVMAAAAATKKEDSNAPAPVAATYQTMIVALRSTSAKFLALNADGATIYESGWMESAVTAATLLSPWIFVQTRTTAARAVSIDRIDYWQRQTTT